MSEANSNSSISTVATRVELLTDERPPILSDTMVQMQLAAAKFEGFKSGEISVSPREGGSNWRLVQRFASQADAARWRISAQRKELMDSLSKSENGEMFRISDEMSQNIKADVATAIVTETKPGKEQEFLEWQAKIQSAQARFPGFRGSSIEPPSHGHHAHWASVLRFDTPEHLEGWFQSQERQVLLGELRDIVSSTKISKVPTSFPGWFPHDEITGQNPARWKTAALVLLGLFPVIMLESLFVVPHLKDFHTPLRSFIAMIGSVAATTFFTMPLFIKWFKWWLLPDKENALKTEVLGLMLLASVFIFEIAAFWRLFPIER